MEGLTFDNQPYTYGQDASTQHLLGQSLGGILNALPGHSTLGQNITNPNVNYQGQTNAYPAGTMTFGQPSQAVQGATYGAPESSQPAPDPYAQWGGKAAYDGLINELNAGKNEALGSANRWADQNIQGYDDSIQGYINQLRAGQDTLNERGVQNELALKQGRQGVLGMVSRGIRSGGVMLANRNAGDSSAAAALANAYGEIGRGQLSSIGNQHAIEGRNIGLAQGQFDADEQFKTGKMRHDIERDVAGTVESVRAELAKLDAWAVGKSLPERIAVEQEKNRIQAELQARFDPVYGRLSGGAGAVNPTSVDQRRATAAELANMGTAATSPFDFMQEAPTQFQNNPFSGNPALFLAPRKKIA